MVPFAVIFELGSLLFTHREMPANKPYYFLLPFVTYRPCARIPNEGKLNVRRSSLEEESSEWSVVSVGNKKEPSVSETETDTP